MHRLEAEIAELARNGEVDPDPLAAATLRELREPFSVRAELLILLYAAIASLIAGVGLLVRANLERLGPGVLTGLLCGAAVLCYALALRRRTLWLDWVLLLGALLTSSAVGYGESQFHWLGGAWPVHLLVLAVWHTATAYLYDSRLVLSVALATFAAWLGIELRPAALLDSAAPLRGLAGPAIGCALLCGSAAFVHARSGIRPAFREVYETFAANLALAGALAAGFADGSMWIGAVLLMAFAIGIACYGLWRRRESLVLGAVAYATFGAVALEARLADSALTASNLGLLTVSAAVWLLLRLRARLKQEPA